MEKSTPRKPRRRDRIGWRGELLLAALPTATVLLVLWLVETLSRQQLLFASLASSAFLIYLDPGHAANNVRTLVFAQMGAALVGFACYAAIGPGYASGGSAMLLTIAFMIALDVLHPPAVATALGFALRTNDEKSLTLFGMAVGITALLVILQRISVWLLGRVSRKGRR